MKNQIKTLFSLAIFMVLTACGSDDESIIDLSVFKGLQTEPELTADTIADGDPLYLNYEYTGSMSRAPSENDIKHIFSFSVAETGLVVMDLTSTSVEADLRVYVDGDEDGLNLIGIGGGDDILVLEATAGITYSVEASIYLENADTLYAYSLVVAEANRERLELLEDEYWLGIDISQSETCIVTNSEDTNVYESSFSLGIILNTVDAYFRAGDKYFYLTKTSSNRYEFRSSETDGGEGWSTSSDVAYDLKLDGNSGSITLDAEYTNVETYSETTTCNGIESWSGNVLL